MYDIAQTGVQVDISWLHGKLKFRFAVPLQTQKQDQLALHHPYHIARPVTFTSSTASTLPTVASL